MTFTTRPTLQGTFGMVSSTHWIASQSAMRALERGGNAFDAAVCAGFVLHVVEPHLNGPGGEVPAIIATVEDPAPRVLCGQGTAPAGATISHFTSLGIDLIPGSGPLAAAVPGAVDAWLLLLRDKGTQTLQEVLEPAIGYARGGHPIGARISATITSVRELFEAHWPTSAQAWLRNGQAPVPGSLFANATYADTLQRLVDEGRAAGPDREAQIDAARRAWGQGFVAEAVDSFARKPFRDSSGGAHAGLVTGQDMADFEATWEEPVILDWHGYSVAKTQAWGQGPALLQTMRLLDALDDPGTARPVDGLRYPRHSRGHQAFLRRPRGVVRRRAGRAPGHTALPRVCRCTGHVGGQAGFGGAAPGQSRWTRTENRGIPGGSLGHHDPQGRDYR